MVYQQVPSQVWKWGCYCRWYSSWWRRG